MQIRNDPALKWPGKLLTDPDKRPRDKYCRFHRDHGHNTEDCYDLKRQIEELIKQGKLQRFVEKGQREGRPQGARQQRPPGEAPPRPPLGEIHVITGGMAAGGTSRSSRKAYARQIHNVLVTQKSNKNRGWKTFLLHLRKKTPAKSSTPMMTRWLSQWRSLAIPPDGF